jgi:uncharacterized membrane protein
VEELLARLANAAATLIEAGAVLVVVYASVEAFIRVVGLIVTRAAGSGGRKAIWRRYGVWLLLGLEFELAADIVRSVVSPTWKDLGELGAIAVIRTFLNYFLGKDLENVEKREGSEAATAARKEM